MLNILIKYIANEPMAAVGFAGIYIFGSIEIALRFWSAGHSNIAVFFLSTVIVFTKIYFKRLLLIIRKAKKD
jgi:hypothetical protein